MEIKKYTIFSFFELANAMSSVIKIAFGDCFATIGVRDPYPQACEVFTQFGDYHRKMEKMGIQTIKTIKPVSGS